jgi:hypothetical protein
MELSDNVREYARTIGEIVMVEGTGLIHDLRELNICQELGETSCGLINLGSKILHNIVKHLVVNIPMAVFETTVQAYDRLNHNPPASSEAMPKASSEAEQDHDKTD